MQTRTQPMMCWALPFLVGLRSSSLYLLLIAVGRAAVIGQGGGLFATGGETRAGLLSRPLNFQLGAAPNPGTRSPMAASSPLETQARAFSLAGSQCEPSSA